MSGQNFFSQRIINFFHKDTDDYEDECYDFRMSFLILNKYWECHEITEYLKMYSWSKHVKQINEFLMEMRNMWWHFRFLFGQTVFLNCLTKCQTSCLGFSICLWLLKTGLINMNVLEREIKIKVTYYKLLLNKGGHLNIQINSCLYHYYY
jgi:hypothetical protein